VSTLKSSVQLDERILKRMISKQDRNRYYNPDPDHISYRNELIEWLKTLSEKLKFQTQTWHMSVAILDSFLSRCIINKKDKEMVAFVTLYLAGKHSEITEKIPPLSKILCDFKNYSEK
jgi:hypothetical protein